jgi:hypothetical protein
VQLTGTLKDVCIGHTVPGAVLCVQRRHIQHNAPVKAGPATACLKVLVSTEAAATCSVGGKVGDIDVVQLTRPISLAAWQC